MKQSLKRFGAIIIAAMMAASLMIPAALATEGTVEGAGAAPAVGKNVSLPDSARPGSLTIYKYESKGNLEDGTPLDGAPATGVDGGVLEGYKPLKNVTFSVYKTGIAFASYGPGLTYTPNEADRVQGTTDEHGIVRFAGLESAQIYYVVEEPNASVAALIAPFFISVPLTHPTNANEWIYDVAVYPKNTLEGIPGIDKDVTEVGKDKDSASIGGEVNWLIMGDIPKDIATAEKYSITDVLDSRLTYKEATATLNGVALPGLEVSNASGTLTFTFSAEAKAAMAKAWEGFTAAENGAQMPVVTIKLVTTVNETAAGDLTDIVNNASLDYTNSVGTAYAPAEVPENERPHVTLGGLKLHKVDGDDKTVSLAGAEFALYLTEAEALAGGAPFMTATSGQDGMATFLGLAHGEYWVVETKAPTYMDGTVARSYNLLTAPLKVTVDGETVNTAVEVENRKGFVLPITGGMGTTLFTGAGIALLAGAGVLVVFKGKKGSSK